MKGKALSLARLRDLMVTGADTFTILRYLRYREVVPRLAEVEECGVPGAEGVVADLYYLLWDPEPALKEEVPVDRRYWREAFSQLLGSAAYRDAHSLCRLDGFKSALGAAVMAEEVFAGVTEEDRRGLERVSELRRFADGAALEASLARRDAEALLRAAREASERGVLVGLAEEARSRAGSAQSRHDAAVSEAERVLAGVLGGPGTPRAREKRRLMARAVSAAARKASAAVREAADALASWGVDPGTLSREEVPGALRLASLVAKNQAFRKFSLLLGRVLKVAGRAASSSGAGRRQQPGEERGRDVRRAVPAEVAALSCPETSLRARVRWARGRLRLKPRRSDEPLGRGPVVVCEDASGSMEGAKHQWAKAVVLSLARFAREQGRSFAWVLFDAKVQQSRVYPGGRLTVADMAEIAESRAAGGTKFEPPLRAALDILKKEGMRRADVVFVTDGICRVDEGFLEEFRRTKSSLEGRVHSVLMDVGEAADESVREFSDSVERVSSFTVEEAERKVFSRL